jgi:hypothetical protein
MVDSFHFVKLLFECEINYTIIYVIYLTFTWVRIQSACFNILYLYDINNFSNLARFLMT